jgi:NADPH:quinone reductase-like Zn-dependent oxidoreductase
MRAAIRHEYGPPDVLHVDEVETPSPAAGEVRIRVRAASVNLGDWELLTGEPPWITTLANLFAKRSKHALVPTAGEWKRPPIAGRREAKFKVLGTDVAGTVDAVGREVTRFRPGHEVFGDCSLNGFGAFAEHVCVSEHAALVPKPPGMTFEQAAALPQAGFIAVQGIRDMAGVGPGAKVLVNGAGGGAGTVAVQLAKHLGAEVTGVDGPHKLDMLRSIGADHVLDYTTADYTESGERYDAILDMAAYRSLSRSRRALTPNGVYMLGGGAGGPSAQAAFLGRPLSLLGNGRIRFLLAHSREENLTLMTELFAAGAVVPVVDSVHALDQAGEALRRVGEKLALGKVVIAP